MIERMYSFPIAEFRKAFTDAYDRVMAVPAPWEREGMTRRTWKARQKKADAERQRRIDKIARMK
jgi:hypothetical protein